MSCPLRSNRPRRLSNPTLATSYNWPPTACWSKKNYTPELEQELLQTIGWMREDMRDGYAERNHDDPARCAACSYAVYCDQKLIS
jgi:hypothetical protein